MEKKYCPRCNRDISDSHQVAEPGLYPAHWYCEECRIAVLDNSDPEHYEYELMEQLGVR